MLSVILLLDALLVVDRQQMTTNTKNYALFDRLVGGCRRSWSASGFVDVDYHWRNLWKHLVSPCLRLLLSGALLSLFNLFPVILLLLFHLWNSSFRHFLHFFLACVLDYKSAFASHPADNPSQWWPLQPLLLLEGDATVFYNSWMCYSGSGHCQFISITSTSTILVLQPPPMLGHYGVPPSCPHWPAEGSKGA